MQESVHDIERCLGGRPVAKLRPAACGGIRAQHDLSVFEGDDIRGTGNIHELPVNFVDAAVAHQSDDHFLEAAKRIQAVSGLQRAPGQRTPGKAHQRSDRERH